MPKKTVKSYYDNIVVGSDVRALLYSFTRNMTCFYVHLNKIDPIVQPSNEFVLDNFCSEEKIANENKQEKFLQADKLEFFLRYILNLDGKLYQINRDNLRYTDGNLVHKTNKTEFVLQPETIHLLDNIKLNGASHKQKQRACIVEDHFRTNAKSMEKTWFRGHDPFLNFICIDGKILKSRFHLNDDRHVNDFDNSTVTIRYMLEDFLTGNEEIRLIRDYYRSLKPKLENRIIVSDYRYNTEEDNIKVIEESLEQLCQQPILPPQESYLYYLTKRILDLIGTTA
tara:strand:+ start:1007 stop:1855 length:849 start_codon:yes stop_codon:yes gene_type:complete